MLVNPKIESQTSRSVKLPAVLLEVLEGLLESALRTSEAGSRRLILGV